MALQSSGPISMSQINSVLKLGNSLNSYRGQFGLPSGPISFADFYGKSGVAYIRTVRLTFTARYFRTNNAEMLGYYSTESGSTTMTYNVSSTSAPVDTGAIDAYKSDFQNNYWNVDPDFYDNFTWTNGYGVLLSQVQA
jgi:hypothetical protein